MPVFSIEWLLMNNFENIENTKIDKEIDKYKVIKNNLIFQFKGVLDIYIREELKQRKYIESLEIKKKKFIQVNKEESYDKYECDLCTSYGFFSFYKCLDCKFEGCMNHFPFCKCEKKEGDYVIYYRYDNSVKWSSKFRN